MRSTEYYSSLCIYLCTNCCATRCNNAINKQKSHSIILPEQKKTIYQQPIMQLSQRTADVVWNGGHVTAATTLCGYV